MPFVTAKHLASLERRAGSFDLIMKGAGTIGALLIAAILSLFAWYVCAASAQPLAI